MTLSSSLSSSLSSTAALRTGMFVMPIHDPAKSLVQCIDEDLELAVTDRNFDFPLAYKGKSSNQLILILITQAS